MGFKSSVAYYRPLGVNPVDKKTADKADVSLVDELAIEAAARLSDYSTAGNSADYYDIEVEEAISVVSTPVVLNTCFALRDPGLPFCQLLTRFPTDAIREGDAGNDEWPLAA